MIALGLLAPIVLAQTIAAQESDTLRLSLAEAAKRALTASDEVGLAIAQVDVTEAQISAARAAGLPQLRLSSTYTHAFANARAQAVGQVFNQPDSYNTNLNLSQSLFQGGRISGATRAAEYSSSATRLDLEEIKARTATVVQRAYLEARFAEQLVTLQRNNLELATARLRQVEQLESAGRAARYDVLRSRVERANIEPLVIQAESSRELAILELKRLLNVPFERPIQLTTSIDTAWLRRTVSTVDMSIARVNSRPALKAAELLTDVRREAITIARADRFPTVSVFLQSGFQALPPPGTGFPVRRGAATAELCGDDPTPGRVCQNGGWFSDRSIGTTVSWPIFDGFRARSNVELARAQLRLAEGQLQQEREALTVEAARARAELTRARVTFEVRGQNAAEAVEAFQLATLRFTRGLSTQLEVADAQLAMFTAQSGQARSVVDLYLAFIEFERSVGRPVPLPADSAAGGASQ